MPPRSLGHLLTEASSTLNTFAGESSLLDDPDGADVAGGAFVEPMTEYGPHLPERLSYWHGDASL